MHRTRNAAPLFEFWADLLVRESFVRGRMILLALESSLLGGAFAISFQTFALESFKVVAYLVFPPHTDSSSSKQLFDPFQPPDCTLDHLQPPTFVLVPLL